MKIWDAIKEIVENPKICATNGQRIIFCNSFGAIQERGYARHLTLDANAMASEWGLIPEEWYVDAPQIVDEFEENECQIVILQSLKNWYYVIRGEKGQLLIYQKAESATKEEVVDEAKRWLLKNTQRRG